MVSTLLMTEIIVAMVRVTQPTNEEIGYQYQVAFATLVIRLAQEDIKYFLIYQ